MPRILTFEVRSGVERQIEPLPVGGLANVLIDAHHFVFIKTVTEGFHTGRPRFAVLCRSCERMIHEATTGPLERVEQHLSDVQRPIEGATGHERMRSETAVIFCACGENEARYINELGELCCGLCPIKQGLDSIKISDVPRLLGWARITIEYLETKVGYVCGHIPAGDSVRAMLGRIPKVRGVLRVTPDQLVEDQTYKTWVPGPDDGAIIGEELAKRLPRKP